MGKWKRLFSNAAIMGAGTFISKLLVFLLMPLYTAYLSSAEFGVADILTQTANLIIPIAVLGIGDGLFRFTIDADPNNRKQVFSTAIITLAVGMIPLALLIQLLRLFSVFDGYIWLVFAYICTANLHLIVANYVRGCDRTKIFAVQGIINTLLVIGFNVLFLVAFDMGVTGYVLSVILADFLVSVGLIVFCKLYKDIKPKGINKGLVKELFKFSIPYIPLTLMWIITSVSDRFVILATLGENATAVNGLYAAAYKIPTLITIAGSIFIKAWQISSVSERNVGERATFFGTVYKNYLSVIFVGGAGLIAFSQIFTRLLLHESYFESWRYVPILAIAMVFSAFSEFLGSVYFVHKRSARSLLTAAVGAIVNIVLNFALIPSLGAMGAAIATAICYGIVFFIRVIDTKKYIPFSRAPIKTVVNTVAILAQTVLMLLQLPYWWIYQIAFVLFMAAFNGRDIVRTVITMLKTKSKK
jgi:O-antigen/teichoic acid export membrane protein